MSGYVIDCRGNGACEAADRQYKNGILSACASETDDANRQACVGSYYTNFPASYDATVQATQIAQGAFEKLRRVVGGEDANTVFGGATAPTGQGGGQAGAPQAAQVPSPQAPQAAPRSIQAVPQGTSRPAPPPVTEKAYTGEVESPNYPYMYAQTRGVLLVHNEEGADAYVVEEYGYFDGSFCADNPCGFSRCYYFSDLNGNKPVVDMVFAEAIADFVKAGSRAGGKTSEKLGRPEEEIRGFRVVGFQRCEYGSTDKVEAVVGKIKK